MEENKTELSEAVEEVKEETAREKFEISPLRNSPDSKWYVLHTFSGYEQVAKDNLETVVEKFNLQDRIFDIIIPMEDVIEEKTVNVNLFQRKLCLAICLLR